MSLPRDVVQEDHRLEEQAEKAGSALAELRWHWTLDESNPERVSIREYARAVGRAEGPIRRSANACVQYRTHPGISMAEARTRANLSADRLAATQAVANIRGVTLETAEHKRRDETRRVQQIAAERAERHGTSIEEEAPKVAEWVVRAEKAEQTRQAKRKEQRGLRYIEMEGHLKAAQRKLVEALNMSHDVPWGDEERDLLAGTVQNIRALLNLIDMALVGAAEIDWDSELAALTKE